MNLPETGSYYRKKFEDISQLLLQEMICVKLAILLKYVTKLEFTLFESTLKTLSFVQLTVKAAAYYLLLLVNFYDIHIIYIYIYIYILGTGGF